MKIILSEQFGDLISQNTATKPNGILTYDVIDFKRLISLLFPNHNLTISIDTLKLRKELISKYKDDKFCFSENGSLKQYHITNLLYYQTDTGLEGPKYHDINEPVSILKYKNQLILWEGYHRALMKIVSNDWSIRGYELEL